VACSLRAGFTDARRMGPHCAFREMLGCVWMAGGLQVEEPEAALTCHAAGSSLYFRSSQDAADVLVAAMNADVGMGFAGYQSGALRGEIEVFASRKGHVTSWHQV
jgi:hypothetical protein